MLLDWAGASACVPSLTTGGVGVKTNQDFNHCNDDIWVIDGACKALVWTGRMRCMKGCPDFSVNCLMLWVHVALNLTQLWLNFRSWTKVLRMIDSA